MPKAWKNKPKESFKMGEGAQPEKIAKAENMKHNERKVLSLIDIPTWDKAKWHGTLFMIYHDGVFPPCIGLLFKDEGSARKIFGGWLDQLSNRDEKEALRISIITGIDKKNPCHYRVHVGTNIKAHDKTGEQQLLMVSRINTMTPDNDKNLCLFLNEYKKYGVYCLMPAIWDEGRSEPKIISDLLLYKKTIIVKLAWQISDNDEDLVVLQTDDEPIIPEEENNAPVFKALERTKHMRERI
jgi:hypothetical protein